jgi:hypothetical protein
MPELSHIDPGSAALLVMDYQVDTLTRFVTAAQSADAIACVPHLIATPGKGNDKGKVEGLVGYARRNFLVPFPVFESFEALNAYLVDCCRRRMADRLRGHDETIAHRLERDLAAFRRPPPPAYDACEKVATRLSSLRRFATGSTTTRSRRRTVIATCLFADMSMTW